MHVAPPPLRAAELSLIPLQVIDAQISYAGYAPVAREFLKPYPFLNRPRDVLLAFEIPHLREGGDRALPRPIGPHADIAERKIQLRVGVERARDVSPHVIAIHPSLEIIGVKGGREVADVRLE